MVMMSAAAEGPTANMTVLQHLKSCLFFACNVSVPLFHFGLSISDRLLIADLNTKPKAEVPRKTGMNHWSSPVSVEKPTIGALCLL